MPEDRNLKRLRDRKYRKKTKDDSEYRKRRSEASKRCVAKKKMRETERDCRMRRKNDRERQRKHRQKRFSTSVGQLLDADALNTSARSVAASIREKKKQKMELVTLKLEKRRLERKAWRLSKRLYRKKENKLKRYA